ncbi:DUF1571 domain-containing protein [Tautonia sociabilis]|uniref:DUF1571 domain-containing protein n=1 Tax=Tautonia sociabilis TaxID=2080755 RepID=A0A432MNE2_9BACT|nr:DUF1571 domain-containing protein [Tautonia sociabilis]RUL88707.1 DUF1571 domain-containing protein [Tautonia sociabilis]
MGQGSDRLRASARRWRGIVLLAISPVVLAAGVRWMVSAPIDAAGAPSSSWAPAPELPVSEAGPAPDPLSPVGWPDGPLTGPEAKRRLHRAMLALVGRLERLDGYEAIIRRRERVGGSWLREQRLQMKVRHRPASVYLKDIGVDEGCEIIYVEGLRGGKLLSHPGGGLLGLLVPPIELHPESPLAMSQSRFPITEAGLLPVARRLLDAADRDREDPGASVVLDRVEGEDGRTELRSVQRYDAPADGRPFARVEVRFDPETLLPRSYRYHDWPDSPGTPPPLGGCYIVESFDPDASPVDLDFDPTNPRYRFR